MEEWIQMHLLMLKQKKKNTNKSNEMKKQLNEDSSQMLFIDEPAIFSTQFFINTIISCDMQIQLYPLKHFLTFCIWM